VKDELKIIGQEVVVVYSRT